MAESPTASPIMMNRYVTLQALGDGTYGSVVLGQRVDTGEKVGGHGGEGEWAGERVRPPSVAL